MAEIKVLFKTKEEPSKEKVNEEHNWYDIIRKEMLVFQGGKLSFRYKEDEYLVKMGEVERHRRGIKSTFRMLPAVEDFVVNNHFDMVTSTNRKDIKKWFNSYGNYSDAYMTGFDRYGMEFEVPDDEKEDFCYELERQGFRYE